MKRFFELQHARKHGEAFGSQANPEFSWAVSIGDSPELTAAVPWNGPAPAGREGYKALTGALFGEFKARRFHEVGKAVIAEGLFRSRHRTTGTIAASDRMARSDMRDGRISGGHFWRAPAP